MTTVQTLTDSGKMNDITTLAKPFCYPSQNQKSCKSNAQATAICSTFAFAQPHPRPFSRQRHSLAYRPFNIADKL
ncbi:hypothetical protein [Flavobacterium sp.]|uniref:hypothetical protein n=1 Tax=Flavobacterium sp. TaxID=239 RepID=UPI00260D8B74|nr:hypothetical protein [Flavobacterium sp.]MDD2987274.1 hypothetical protein [Flavobacterium sp.]